MRRWLLWLLLLAFVALAFSRWEELQNLVQAMSETARQGHPSWLAAAVLSIALYYLAYAASFQAAFRAVEVRRRVAELLPLIFGMFFVNVVAPAGGAAGYALLVDDSSRRGHPAGHSMAAAMLQLVADFAGLCLLLVMALLYLFQRGRLVGVEASAAFVLFLLTLAISLGLFVGFWRPAVLRRFLAAAEKAVHTLGGWIGRPILGGVGWGERFADQVIQAAQSISRRPKWVILTFLVMLIGHFLALGTLAFLFLAFERPASLGVLLAGYAVGLLFWIVSPLPQGVGIVESAMAFTFASLGVETHLAALIALTFRGLIFWIPLGLGFFFVQRLRTFTTQEKKVPLCCPRAGIGAVFLSLGLVNLLWAAIPFPAEALGRLRSWVPLLFEAPGRVFNVVFGLALLLLGNALRRGKRFALWVLLGLTLLSIVVHLEVERQGMGGALLAAVLAFYLLRFRSHFPAGSEGQAIQRGLRLWVIQIVAGALIGVAAFAAKEATGAGVNQSHSLGRVLVMLTLFHDPAVAGGGSTPVDWFIYACGAGAWFALLWAFDQPVRLVREPSEAERQLVRRIVQQYGRSSTAHLTLLRDKHYFLSQGGSVVAFTVRGRVALALGDPIGPEEDICPAIDGFCTFCAHNDWLPAFCLTTACFLDHYRQRGLRALCLGYEGIVDLSRFTLRGNAAKTFRKRYNRLSALGYRLEVHAPPLPDELVRELRQVSDEWLGTARSPEKRFFLAWFEEEYVRQECVALVRAPDGRVVAFANLMPEYQLNEIGIDLMRRRPDTESGTMDFLFVSLFLWARQRGYATFNLGLSPLYGVGTQPNAPWLERLIHLVYERGHFYDFRGLNAFKSKFRPRWEAQYLVYPGWLSLIPVGLTMARVNAGEGESLWHYFRNHPKRFQEETKDDDRE